MGLGIGTGLVDYGFFFFQSPLIFFSEAWFLMIYGSGKLGGLPLARSSLKTSLWVEFSCLYSHLPHPHFFLSYFLVSFGSLGLRQWGRTGHMWDLQNVVYDLVRGTGNKGPG